MWTYGFFNSVDGDRVYNADQMSKMFEGLITDGVYESVGDKLAVRPNTGMTIEIGSGRGFFSKRWVNNDNPYQMTLEASDVTLNRYCAVCVRVDSSDAVRKAEPMLKYSEFATTPIKPTMTRTEQIQDYCLAYVYIPAKASVITEANIEDTRFNTELCGWVTGLIDQVDTETLYTQWTEIFNDFMIGNEQSFSEWYQDRQNAFNVWFSGLQDMIDENVEAMLVNALPTSTSVTLSANGWSQSGDVYTQTANVTNMNATKSVIIQPNNSTMNLYSSARVRATGQNTNAIIFTADKIPNGDVIADILHMGV